MNINRKICPAGLKNNPNKPLTAIKYITIHCTANYTASATALSHANYQYNGSGGAQASWHYTVDKNEIWQSFEDTQACWHASDGSSGPGNSSSIAIEICVNDKPGFGQACDNAAWLTAQLLKRHSLAVERIRQHYDWNGKNCPMELRSGAWGITWANFLTLVKQQAGKITKAMDEQMPTLRRGDKNGNVTIMQEYLNAFLINEGLAPIETDGSFGGASESAVKLFQSMQGLAVDGVCGPKTWAALKAYAENLGADPDPTEDQKAVELTVTHLIADGVITDPDFWRGYLSDTSDAARGYVKTVFDRYHEKLTQQSKA